MSLDNTAFLDELVARGQFESRDAAIDQAITLLRAEIEQNGRIPRNSESADEWCERLAEWAASHRSLPHEADDSRDSIYEGCGE